MWSSYFTPWYLFKGNQTICPHTVYYINIHNDFIFKKLKNIEKVFISRWIDIIVFTNKKKYWYMLQDKSKMNTLNENSSANIIYCAMLLI